MQLQNRCIVMAGVMVALITAVSAQAQTRTFPPVSQSGYLGYDFTTSRSDDNDTQGHTALFNWNIGSYIKQPYIAQYMAGVTLLYSKVDSSSQNTKTNTIFGNLTFRLFPSSKFPFEFYLLRQSRQIDDSLGDFINTNMTYGVMQRYTSRKLTTYSFRYEQNKQTFDDRIAVRDQNGENTYASLDISRIFGKWSLQWDNQYLKQVNNHTKSTISRAHSILRHTWQPGHGLSMTGFTTYRNTEMVDPGGFSTQNQRYELNNNIYWRPNTRRPMSIVSNFRHVEFIGDRQNPLNIGSSSTVLTAGLDYQFTDRFGVVANATGALVGSGTDDVFQFSSRFRARYISTNHEWRGYRYRWNTSLGVGTDDKEDQWGNVVTGTAQLGHNLDKVFFRNSFPLTVGISQGITQLEGTDGRSTTSTNQLVFVNWRSTGIKRSSMLNLSGSRFQSKGGGGRFGDENNTFNLATLVFSQTENFSRHSRLVGSLSIQHRFQQSDFNPDGRKAPSGSADITYMHRSLFNVPGLFFRSSLRWYSNNFKTAADDPSRASGTRGGFWENRLDYRLGRLDFRIITRFTTVNDINRNYLFFQVRRHFGGMLIN